MKSLEERLADGKQMQMMQYQAKRTTLFLPSGLSSTTRTEVMNLLLESSKGCELIFQAPVGMILNNELEPKPDPVDISPVSIIHSDDAIDNINNTIGLIVMIMEADPAYAGNGLPFERDGMLYYIQPVGLSPDEEIPEAIN
jgi:hypothetical protein